MEYTIQNLARMAGISSRTLRYYDEIELLKPARINSSGYRIYGQTEVDLLQQILFYRELGLSLENIKEIITKPAFDAGEALQEHRSKLLEKRSQLDLLISNVDKTIAAKGGIMKMSDHDKFNGFKQKMMDENEKKYGEEIRQKYGKETVKKANDKLKNMTQEEYVEVTRLAEQLKATLTGAFKAGDPGSDLAQQAAHLHRQWLSYYWPQYNKEAHASLAQMYVNDERFRAYYDELQPGTAAFLRNAIFIYTGHREP